MEIISRFFQPQKRSFFLFGTRGSGKSTWLHALYPEALYIDLLSPDVFRELAARPERLTEIVEGSKKNVIIIDEIQKAPELLSVVHQMIEQHKSYVFIMTGSSSRKLKRTGADLLAGRALMRTLYPFMAAELGKKFSFKRAISEGMLPIVWQSEKPEDVLKAYAALYLREEVQMEGLVRNVGSFARFLEAISFSHGAVINTSEVARECQVGRKTVEAYLNIIYDLLLAFSVPVFSKRAKRHITQHPKFYYFDTGVFRTLRPQGSLDYPEQIEGAALEGLVAQHLKAFCDYDERGYQLYFWRTKSGVEVDFILYGPSGIMAVEVKRTAQIRHSDLMGLKSFKEDYPQTKMFFLYGGKQRLMKDGVLCMPIEAFLLALRPGLVWEKI